MPSTDPESLQSGAARSRCRRMDACLVGSVFALFALVLAGFAVALLFAWSLKSEMAKLQEKPVLGYAHAEKSQGSPYKSQSFAYLRATSSEMKTGVMGWESIAYGAGNTLGKLYSYDSNHKAITVEREGSYFLYAQLNLSCTHLCAGGSFTLTFESSNSNTHLSCVVQLPSNNEPVVKKCWNVIPRLGKKSRLLARITSETNLDNWELDVNSSGFGMFLVDGMDSD